ncbi:transporter [Bradyrhizobium liaoningense]|uniref:SphA family protein n=1 Tax=Bradyrhizobium liaoningense TaxID=43992 RepID=UPI001BADB6C2|nr:transporter [Bradyrhizobium liaoningense]MBR0742242.1 transporter [Bradyrhizobium liaoningense]MBR0907604.1 transporter [Bradyrhizobium liaoningense]
MRKALIPCLAAAALMTSAGFALGDEGGVSFWLPGNFGSLAAAPGTPGWSWATIYYHGEAAAGAGQQFPRGGRVDVGISGRGDLAFFGPTYTFATPVLGGQAAISILGAAGRNEASAALSLTGPLGNTIALSRTQELTSFGDVIPSATLKWNFGTSNLMVYGMGDVPIGDYDPARLANLGIGHAAVDFGGGYTYFDPKSGNEFSWVAGLTYNFKNPDTQYRSGADFHIDWGASHFFDSKFQLGVVGYYFQQVSDDVGAPVSLDGFRSRVVGIGPQVGYIFPMGDKLQGYVNLKGYREFAAQNRAAGWNTWLTFAISPATPEPTSAKPIIRK